VILSIIILWIIVSVIFSVCAIATVRWIREDRKPTTRLVGIVGLVAMGSMYLTLMTVTADELNRIDPPQGLTPGDGSVKLIESEQPTDRIRT